MALFDGGVRCAVVDWTSTGPDRVGEWTRLLIPSGCRVLCGKVLSGGFRVVVVLNDGRVCVFERALGALVRIMACIPSRPLGISWWASPFCMLTIL